MIIIGAGIAGLAAGCYARMNGYPVDIYEMHDKPGGMCTAWTRKDYVFDYCIHNLAGTAPTAGVYGMWEELGALEGTQIIGHDEFVRVESQHGEVLRWFTNLDLLEQHLKIISAADSAAFGRLIGAARKLEGADLTSMQMGGTWRVLKALPRLPTINRWSKITLGQFASSLKDPFLKRAVLHIMYDMPGDQVPATALILFMSGMDKGDLGWPLGGSLAFSKRVERRFLGMGGSIHYRQRVQKIIVEEGKAVGIRLDDGTERRADYVISAADGYNTIYGMLEGRFLTDQIAAYYDSAGDTSPFGFVIFVGLKKDIPKAPHAITLLYDEPFDVGGMRQDSVHVSVYSPESGLAPEGKSIVKIETQASYSLWKQKRDADLKSYREQKRTIADQIIGRVSHRFPELRDSIEVVDVCTPATAERYTGNRFGWQAGPPKENASKIQRGGLSRSLPGLKGFFHIGQWSNATLGVSNVAMSGRSLVRELCKQDGKRFAAKAH